MNAMTNALDTAQTLVFRFGQARIEDETGRILGSMITPRLFAKNQPKWYRGFYDTEGNLSWAVIRMKGVWPIIDADENEIGQISGHRLTANSRPLADMDTRGIWRSRAQLLGTCGTVLAYIESMRWSLFRENDFLVEFRAPVDARARKVICSTAYVLPHRSGETD
jgi:hypothetical protein